MKTISKYIFCLLLPVLAGCHTVPKPGFPKQSYDENDTIKKIEKQFPASLINDYYAKVAEKEKCDIRNQIIDGRLALMNLNYNQFVAHFSVTRESIDFGSEITELGLNLATTAVGGAAAKTTLAAISAGVTGTKLAIDKNFFFEKTVSVLVGSMNAQRKVALIPILKGIQQGTDAYPLTQALADLDNYYQAGTFVGALQAIQADSGAKEKDAKDIIDSIQLADVLTTAQLADLDVLKRVWSQLNDQITKGNKTITDANQKNILAQSLKPFLGKEPIAADDAGLVKQLHRFYQIQPQRAAELVSSLKANSYPNLAQ